MKTKVANSQRGMTLVEVCVVIALLALMVVILSSYDRNGTSRAKRINCVNNIRQIELAFKTWAPGCTDWMPMQAPANVGGTKDLITNGLAYVHLQTMSNELSNPKLVICPSDRGKTIAESFAPGKFDNANVSFFVGVDASDTYPGMILLGDRNLTLEGSPVKPGLISLATNAPMGWTKDIHVNQGNIGLADGSVQQVSGPRLTAAMQGNGTNRWVVP